MIPKSIHDILNSQFKVDSNKFTETCLEIYRFQMQRNEVFSDWVHLSLGFAKNAKNIPENLQFQHESEIPFLPISLFKTKKISCYPNHEIHFTSSSTTGVGISQHHIHHLKDYEQACLNGYDLFLKQLNETKKASFKPGLLDTIKVQNPNYDVIAALLPSYLDRSGSGLIYMVDQLIKVRSKEGGFYNLQFEQLLLDLFKWKRENKRVLLWGVTFGLLEFSQFVNKEFTKETTDPHTLISELFSQTDILETGGMKGRGPELTRTEVHNQLCEGFRKNAILSEYGMTELTSQAYSLGNGIFQCPPWMKILIQDPSDFRTFLPANKTGRICVIDLMNYHSCSFIATDDLGKTFPDGTFEISGRIDHSDIRGCNQLVFPTI